MYIVSAIIGSGISDSQVVIVDTCFSCKEAKESVVKDFTEIKRASDCARYYNERIDYFHKMEKDKNLKIFSLYPPPPDCPKYVSCYLSEDGNESYINFDNGLSVKYFINYVNEND